MAPAVITEFQGPYRFLSNFAPVHVVLDGESYPSVEHAYQAAKTMNLDERRRVQQCLRPGDAKRLGRTLTLRPDWEVVKLDMMQCLLMLKFSQPRFRAQLLATGDAILQEGNRWGDEFWGVNLRTGRGANHLGRLLMQIRDTARQEVR